MHFSSVVLPVPLGPMIDTTSPRLHGEIDPVQDLRVSVGQLYVFELKHFWLVSFRVHVIESRPSR